MRRPYTIIVVLLVAISVARGQGTVNFANAGATFSAPVIGPDGFRLTGPPWMAELLAGSTAASISPLAATPFLSGGGAGFFNGGVVAVPTVAPGSIGFFQVRVWDTTVGATFAAAQAAGTGYGFSCVFSGPTGGVGIPASAPTSLVGLQNCPLIPEPSSVLLLIMGVSALLHRGCKSL